LLNVFVVKFYAKLKKLIFVKKEKMFRFRKKGFIFDKHLIIKQGERQKTPLKFCFSTISLYRLKQFSLKKATSTVWFEVEKTEKFV